MPRQRIVGGGSHGGFGEWSGGAEKLWLREIGRLVEIVRPFFVWPLFVLMAVSLRLSWPANIGVMAFMAASGVALGFTAMHLSHSRSVFGRLHGFITMLLAAGLLDYIDLVGKTHSVVFLCTFGIFLFCLSWSMRMFIRIRDEADSDRLTEIFEKAGAGQARVTWKMPKPGTTIHKLTGRIHLPRAERTPDDLQKSLRKIEGGMKLPPGSLTAVPNDDDAAVADITLSDPRVLKKSRPFPWVGTGSHPHGSVADPIFTGWWQDGEECEWVITDTHVLVMGMTGAGKSMGAGWGALAELITRDDCVIMAADLTKGDQTLGPFRGSLNRIETTVDGARKMLIDLQASIRPRTDYLASKGLGQWQKGCGIPYIVVWLEEAPDIIDSLGTKGEERWIKTLKAARSAGITFVISMQRADWSQLPTVARSQLAYWCFGVNDARDAGFGLSEVQQMRDCNPALWNRRQPGMFYLDVPGVPEERVALPGRTCFWGNSDAIIRKHTDAWPVHVQLDKVTSDAMENTDNMTEAKSDAEVDAPVEDVHLEGVDENAPIELHPEGSVAFASPVDADSIDPVEARARLKQWITDLDRGTFTAKDLVPFIREVGLDRTWIYKALHELEDETPPVIEQVEEAVGLVYRVVGVKDNTLEKARRFVASGKERAAKYGAPVDPDLKAEDLLPLFHAGSCYLCGDPLNGDRQIDHKTPLKRGGAHALSNLGAACSYCNEAKGDMTEKEFREKMDAV